MAISNPTRDHFPVPAGTPGAGSWGADKAQLNSTIAAVLDSFGVAVPVAKTLDANGELAATSGSIVLDTYAGAASDDLERISLDLPEGRLIMVTAAAGRTFAVKHQIAGGSADRKITTVSGDDFLFANGLSVFFRRGGTGWVEERLSAGAIASTAEAVVRITDADSVIPRSARRFSETGDEIRITKVVMALSAAGDVFLPSTSEVDDRYVIYREPGSAVPTVKIQGGGGTIDGMTPGPTTTALPASGSVTLWHQSTDEFTSDLYFEIEEGAFDRQRQYVNGAVEGVADTAGLLPNLSAFNVLAEESRSVAGSTTFAAGDAGRIVRVTAAGTVTIPANSALAYPIGTVLTAYADTAGTVTLAINTDTLRPAPGMTLNAAGRYAHISARKRTATEWVAFGQFDPS